MSAGAPRTRSPKLWGPRTRLAIERALGTLLRAFMGVVVAVGVHESRVQLWAGGGAMLGLYLYEDVRAQLARWDLSTQLLHDPSRVARPMELDARGWPVLSDVASPSPETKPRNVK